MAVIKTSELVSAISGTAGGTQFRLWKGRQIAAKLRKPTNCNTTGSNWFRWAVADHNRIWHEASDATRLQWWTYASSLTITDRFGRKSNPTPYEAWCSYAWQLRKFGLRDYTAGVLPPPPDPVPVAPLIASFSATFDSAGPTYEITLDPLLDTSPYAIEAVRCFRWPSLQFPRRGWVWIGSQTQVNATEDITTWFTDPRLGWTFSPGETVWIRVQRTTFSVCKFSIRRYLKVTVT